MKHNKRSFKELITKDECEDEASSILKGFDYISDETFDGYVNQLYKKYKYNYKSIELPKEQKQKTNDFDKRLREQEREDRIFKMKKDNMHVIEKEYGTKLYIENGKKVKYSKVKWVGCDKFDWVRTNSIEKI